MWSQPRPCRESLPRACLWGIESRCRCASCFQFLRTSAESPSYGGFLVRALASESRGCKANSYVLVSTDDLQPRDAEWKDIALRRQGRRVEEHLSGSRANRCSASLVIGRSSSAKDERPTTLSLLLTSLPNPRSSPADPSGHRGFRSGAALRVGRFLCQGIVVS